MRGDRYPIEANICTGDTAGESCLLDKIRLVAADPPVSSVQSRVTAKMNQPPIIPLPHLSPRENW